MCPEARRLTRQYEDAVAAFKAKQAKLDANIGTLPRREYLALSRAVLEHRAAMPRARAELELHFLKHACKTATA